MRAQSSDVPIVSLLIFLEAIAPAYNTVLYTRPLSSIITGTSTAALLKLILFVPSGSRINASFFLDVYQLLLPM